MKTYILSENRKYMLPKAISCFLLGFVFSCADLWDGISPFSAAFTASLSPFYSSFSVLGTTLGAVIFSDFGDVSRIILSLSVFVIKLLLHLILKRTAYINNIISCAIPSIIFSVFRILSGADYYAEIVLYVGETVISTAMCYFFCIGIELVTNRDRKLTDIGTVSAVICLSAIICSLNRFSISGISVGTLLAIVILLCCTRFSHSAGAFLSIAFFAVLSLGNPIGILYYSVIPIGIIITIVFRSSGKYLSSVVFLIVTSTLSLLFGGISDNLLPVILTYIVSSVIFVIIPEKVLRTIYSYFHYVENDTGIKSVVSGKLLSAAGSVGTLANVLDRLMRLPNADKSTCSDIIISNTCDTICKKCKYNSVCMTERYNDIADVLHKAVSSYAAGADYAVPKYFINLCKQPQTLMATVKSEYIKNAENAKNNSRLSAVKNSVSETYRTLSYMLYEMSEELTSICTTDADAENNLRATLNSLKIPFSSLSAVIKEYGRRFFEFTTESELSESTLSDIISSLSERSLETFSPVCAKTSENCFTYSFTESENYKISSSVFHIHQIDSSISGDECLTFSDSDGYFYSVMCDGEGTGKRAAAQAIMASSALRELIIGGIPLKSAIKTTGCMLISKDDRECSCTADIVKIDKYTGNAEFLKAGGSITLLKHDGKVRIIKGKSIPIGIVGELNLFEYRQRLSPGDIIVMLTDGAAEFSEEVLISVLSSKKCDNIADFSEIIEKIIKESGITFSDDATLSAIQIQNI